MSTAEIKGCTKNCTYPKIDKNGIIVQKKQRYNYARRKNTTGCKQL